ncbi:MAG: TetR family transcriptional regulator [Flavobacterium sp.]|nr:MAG: TetR family transcriptional regulator [Flavobacterium sp.]
MKFTKRQIEIIESATILIGEKGIQNLTTKNLAKKMSFTEPALYRHFKNKTEILKSILIYYKENLGIGLKTIFNSDITGLDKINKMIDFQFDHFTKFPSVVMVIFSETSFQYDNTLSKVVSDIIAQKRVMVSKIITSGQDEGSIRNDIGAEQLTTVVLGSMRLTVLEWRLSNYNFSLTKKGLILCRSIEILLKKE